MCLHCIGKVSNCSIKSCGRSWSVHEGTIYAYTNTLLGKNCLSSHCCHFVKNYFFWTKLLHAYVQCVYIVAAKYQILPSKAVVGVDRPMKAPSMHIHLELQREITLVELAPSPYFLSKVFVLHIWTCLQGLMKIQKWLFKILRKQNVTDRRTDARTDGQHENSIPTTNKVSGGYNEKLKKEGKMRISILFSIYTVHFTYLKVYTKFKNTASNRSWEICDRNFHWRER